MKLPSFFVVVIPVLFCISCGGNNSNDTSNVGDTTSTSRTDSAMSAHNRDPSIAFPQPPVSGSMIDSSRSQDSVKKDSPKK